MKKALIAVLFAMITTALTAAPYTLDWTDVDYTGGSLNQTFTNVDSSGVNMDFQITNQTDKLSGGTPDDEDALNAIYPGAEHGLWYATELGGDVGIVITFSELVTNVSFGIYDIDGIGYDQESVRIKGFDDLGNAVDLTNYWYSNGSDVEVYTDGTDDFGYQFINKGDDDTDPGVDDWQKHMAMIGIDGGVEIRKIGIAFLNNDGNRGQILTDISYDYVPEPATMLLLGLGSVALLKRRKA